MCPVCAAPVGVGTLRVYERGAFYHAGCRSRQLARAALLEHDGDTAPDAGIADDGACQSPCASDRLGAVSVCPLCQQAAVVQQDAGAAWCAVHGCACGGGYFVATDVLERRLPRLTLAARVELMATIQGFHAMDREAWLSMGDSSVSGKLLVRATSPAT